MIQVVHRRHALAANREHSHAHDCLCHTRQRWPVLPILGEFA
jgi:hypothetical protein